MLRLVTGWDVTADELRADRARGLSRPRNASTSWPAGRPPKTRCPTACFSKPLPEDARAQLSPERLAALVAGLQSCARLDAGGLAARRSVVRLSVVRCMLRSQLILQPTTYYGSTEPTCPKHSSSSPAGPATKVAASARGSSRKSTRREINTLQVAPGDMERLGLAEGDRVRLTSERGQV